MFLKLLRKIIGATGHRVPPPTPAVPAINQTPYDPQHASTHQFKQGERGHAKF